MRLCLIADRAETFYLRAAIATAALGKTSSQTGSIAVSRSAKPDAAMYLSYLHLSTFGSNTESTHRNRRPS
jgi:hypothetical protein